MVAIVAEEVTAPMLPVVVSGLRFKAKPVLGAEEVLVVVMVAAVVVPGTFNPNPRVPRLVAAVEVPPSERPGAAEEFGTEELAMDANKVGPDEPRREAVVVGAVDVAVKPPSLVPNDKLGPWMVVAVSVPVGAEVAAVEASIPKFKPVDCPPRLKAVAGCAVVAAMVAAAGAAPKVNPVGATC